MVKHNFSIIIPTYTGARTLKAVLDTIRQQPQANQVEAIIVIDGPNKRLRSMVDEYSSDHERAFSSFKIKQFKNNKGRFMARYEGALLATHDNLIFIDDRTELAKNYLEEISRLSIKHKVIISNILEKSQPNFISKTLFFIRKRIYKNWGEDFEPYNITAKNFDKSPKGTAGLSIRKDIFMTAANTFLAANENTKSSNDDTKLLRFIVEQSVIYRSALPILMYLPREHWRDELVHIYRRGPMFVDYYLKQGSPYFFHLLGLYIITVVFLIGVFVIPWVLLPLAAGAFIGAFSIGMVVSKSAVAGPRVGSGLLLIASVFIAGLYKGTFSKLVNRLN